MLEMSQITTGASGLGFRLSLDATPTPSTASSAQFYQKRQRTPINTPQCSISQARCPGTGPRQAGAAAPSVPGREVMWGVERWS